MVEAIRNGYRDGQAEEQERKRKQAEAAALKEPSSRSPSHHYVAFHLFSLIVPFLLIAHPNPHLFLGASFSFRLLM